MVRALRIAAMVEAASLTVLLANLATVHAPAVSSLAGPVHGTAYLAVIAAVWLAPTGAASGPRWRAAVPGIGGLIALRRLDRRGADPSTSPTDNPQKGTADGHPL
ncbi:hypothetical protein NOGI109294_12845 [Nocardiopsis gilva]|uniref:hypothetical protein n=1 Tax=Nocardiopsis gilva TaxID=280236 RepID=UPI00037A1B23|nr:hypothetical protein [Nocardiopsis gilva]